MTSIAVSKLRENLMQVLKLIEKGATVQITSRGKVVAKLSPPENRPKDAERKLKEISETAVIKDIVSPSGENWEMGN